MMEIDVLSLKEIGLIRVATLLCNNSHSLDLFRGFRFKTEVEYKQAKEWNSFLNKIAKQAPKLNLPESLKDQLIPMLKPISAEIFKWMTFIRNFYSDEDLSNDINFLSWTSIGTINYKKTIQNIVNHKELNIMTRLELSCVFCIEEDIRALWGKLTREEKILWQNRQEIYSLHSGVLSFWTYTINGDFTSPFDCLLLANIQRRTIYQYAFETAVGSGNIVATKYFLHKLTCEERDESLLRAANEISNYCFWAEREADEVPLEIFCDIWCFLLDFMSVSEQNEVYRKWPFKVLYCYLQWPRQRLVLHVKERLWAFMDAEDFHGLIQTLAEKAIISAYNFSKLFGTLFVQIPSIYMESIFERQLELGTFLCDLFNTYDLQNIQLVLRSVDSSTREKLVNCSTGFRICLQLISQGKWYLLKQFIVLSNLSDTAKSNIKNNFKLYLHVWVQHGRKYRKLNKGKLVKFYRMLNVNSTNQKERAKDSNHINQ